MLKVFSSLGSHQQSLNVKVINKEIKCRSKHLCNALIVMCKGQNLS